MLRQAIDYGHRKANAIVVFGVSGDLAQKKIFPALHALIRRGALKEPVIGVAKTARTPMNKYEPRYARVLRATMA